MEGFFKVKPCLRDYLTKKTMVLFSNLLRLVSEQTIKVLYINPINLIFLVYYSLLGIHFWLMKTSRSQFLLLTVLRSPHLSEVVISLTEWINTYAFCITNMLFRQSVHRLTTSSASIPFVSLCFELFSGYLKFAEFHKLASI